MLASVTTSPYIQLYLQVVDAVRPRLGRRTVPSLDMPGYDGSTELEYARPRGLSDSG